MKLNIVMFVKKNILYINLDGRIFQITRSLVPILVKKNTGIK